jgi:hypothetical protein
MKYLTPYRTKIFTFVGLFCLSIPIILLALWIHAFNLGTNHVERIEIYNGYLPDFLQGFATTLLSMFFCALSIILSTISLKISSKLWKALNILILVVSSLLLYLNLFSMM